MLVPGKTCVVCELSQTHEGNLALAMDLVKAAAIAKADVVKFHVFRAEELAVPSYKYFDLFLKLQWTQDQWKKLIDVSHQLGLKVFADVLGVDSARMLMWIGIDGIKIHATDVRNKPLLEEFATYNVPLLLSCGGAHLFEVKEAVDILQKHHLPRPLLLMHGFQNYPTLVEHTNLLKMKFFGEQLGLPYGFADHIDGDHAMKFSLCAMAVGMGASVIEKHITSDRVLKMEDYESALNPKDFITFVEEIRQLDLAKGKGIDELLNVEPSTAPPPANMWWPCSRLRKARSFKKNWWP